MDISDVEEKKQELERELTERIKEFTEETGASITRLSLKTVTEVTGRKLPVHVDTTVEVQPEVSRHE